MTSQATPEAAAEGSRKVFMATFPAHHNSAPKEEAGEEWLKYSKGEKDAGRISVNKARVPIIAI